MINKSDSRCVVVRFCYQSYDNYTPNWTPLSPITITNGSRDGAVVTALASHQCGPGSIPGLDVICGLIEFVVGSRLRSEGFSPGSPVFLPPQKTTFLNSNSTWNARTHLNGFLELFGVSWLNKLHLHLHFLFNFYKSLWRSFVLALCGCGPRQQ